MREEEGGNRGWRVGGGWGWGVGGGGEAGLKGGGRCDELRYARHMVKKADAQNCAEDARV